MEIQELTADDLNDAFCEIIDTMAKADRRDAGIEKHGVNNACGCCGRKIKAEKLAELAGYKIGPTCIKKIVRIVATW